MKKLMVVSPHPDDEVLLCGGLLNKLKGKVKVKVVYVTLADKADNVEGKSKIREIGKVSEFYGFKYKILDEMNYEDMCVCDKKGKLMVDLIEEVREFKPDVIVTTHPNDFHTDHRAVGKVMGEVVYQASRKGIMGQNIKWKEPLVLYGEVDMEDVQKMKMDVFIELSKKDIDVKVKALQNYKELVGTHSGIFEHNWGKDWVYSVAKIRGSWNDSEYAEVFEIGNIRAKINFEDLI